MLYYNTQVQLISGIGWELDKKYLENFIIFSSAYFS